MSKNHKTVRNVKSSFYPERARTVLKSAEDLASKISVHLFDSDRDTTIGKITVWRDYTDILRMIMSRDKRKIG